MDTERTSLPPLRSLLGSFFEATATTTEGDTLYYPTCSRQSSVSPGDRTRTPSLSPPPASPGAGGSSGSSFGSQFMLRTPSPPPSPPSQERSPHRAARERQRERDRQRVRRQRVRRGSGSSSGSDTVTATSATASTFRLIPTSFTHADAILLVPCAYLPSPQEAVRPLTPPTTPPKAPPISHFLRGAPTSNGAFSYTNSASQTTPDSSTSSRHTRALLLVGRAMLELRAAASRAYSLGELPPAKGGPAAPLVYNGAKLYGYKIVRCDAVGRRASEAPLVPLVPLPPRRGSV